MKVKRYYIDVENVGRAWVNHFRKMSDDDFMTLFTSKKTCAHYEDFIYVFNSEKMGHFKILEAYVRGNGDSALDYFLMGTLNNEAKINPEDEYIILSGDKGYDHFIKELNDNGISISRIETKKQPPAAKEGCEDTQVTTKKAIESGNRKLTRPELEKEIVTMMRASVRNAQGKVNYLDTYKFDVLAKRYIDNKCNFEKTLLAIPEKKNRSRFSTMINNKTRDKMKELINLNK